MANSNDDNYFHESKNQLKATKNSAVSHRNNELHTKLTSIGTKKTFTLSIIESNTGTHFPTYSTIVNALHNTRLGHDAMILSMVSLI